jgi:recombination protein U
MAKNVGKKFEDNWKASVPEDVYYLRLHDSANSFNQSKNDSTLRFSMKSPYDCQLFDGKTRTLYCLELKSASGKSMSFERKKYENKSANIKYHQIESLTKAAKYDGIVAGLILNFRFEDKDAEITYFQSITDFNRMIGDLNKKSFNIIDLLKYNPIKIEQTKKKVNYTYNVAKFLEGTALPFNISETK